MRVTILFFGPSRSITGDRIQEWHLPATSSLETVREELLARYPRLRPHDASLVLAINGRTEEPEQQIREGDEIAVLPPVSGG